MDNEVVAYLCNGYYVTVRRNKFRYHDSRGKSTAMLLSERSQVPKSSYYHSIHATSRKRKTRVTESRPRVGVRKGHKRKKAVSNSLR